MDNKVTDPSLIAKLNSEPSEESGSAPSVWGVAKQIPLGMVRGVQAMAPFGEAQLAAENLTNLPSPKVADYAPALETIVGGENEPANLAEHIASGVGKSIPWTVSMGTPSPTNLAFGAVAGAGGEAAESLAPEGSKTAAGIAGSLISGLGVSAALKIAQGIINASRGMRTLPEEVAGVKIPTTKGKLNPGDEAQLAEEQAMRAGARGTWAKNTMGASEEATTRALGQAEENITKGVGPPIADEQEVGSAVSSALKRKAAEAESRGNEAYDAAKGKNAWVVAGEHRPTLAVDSALGNEGMALHEGLSTSKQAYDRLRNLERGIASDEAGLRGNEGAPSINAPPSLESSGDVRLLSFNRMLEVRRQLRGMRGVNPEDSRTLGSIKGAYDDWMSHMMNNALFHGDRTALEDWRRGNKFWYEYKNLSEAKKGDAASKTIADIVNGQHTGAEVANWLLNSASLDQAGDAARVAQRIRRYLGGDSQEWEALRSAAWQRLLNPGQLRGRPATPNQTATAVERFVNGTGKPLADALFTKEERQLFQQYSSAMRQSYPAFVNSSKTGHEVARWAWPMIMASLGMAGLEGVAHTGHLRWMGLATLPLLRDVVSTSKAKEATLDYLPRIPVSGRILRGTTPFAAEGAQ